MTRSVFLRALLPCCALASILGGPAMAQPQAAPGTVTLPLDAYDRLLDRAAHPPARLEAPPIAASVAQASMQVQVGNGAVRGTIELSGEVFQAGAIKVPLVRDATLTSVERGGRPVALSADGATHAAVLQGPEPFTVTLGFVAPVTQEPGRASVQLPAPLARSTRLSLEIPRGHAEVLLEGGLVTARTRLDGKTRLEATLEPGRSARVSWTVRDMSTAAAPRAARWVSDVATLASVGEIDLRLAVMLDVSVIMGDPTGFEVKLPEGFELTTSSGASLDSSRTTNGVLTLVVSDPSRRRHQFLLALERTTKGGLLQTDVPLLSLAGAERETGEVAVEGLGTMELQAKEEGTLRRMDVREAGPTLRALARQPLLAAFRYHRRPSEPLRLTIEAHRFPDAPVLAAMAERAMVTTLVTAEGRSLSEVQLTVRNQAQPYLRVALPQGATLVSAAIEGQAVKPVEGADGARVPLLRPGFRPTGPYSVSFVYMGAGSTFGKKGEARLSLARMDLPISALYWEMFVPDRYKLKGFGGDAWRDTGDFPLPSGQIAGTVTDSTGAVIPGATVTAANESTGAEKTSTTDAVGRYVLLDLPVGTYALQFQLPGFKSALRRGVSLDGGTTRSVDCRLEVGAITETVSVMAAGASPSYDAPRERESKVKVAAAAQMPSRNVVDLQRRVAGVLPIRIDVPRTGTSMRFVRPLVLDEETTVTFQYKTR